MNFIELHCDDRAIYINAEDIESISGSIVTGKTMIIGFGATYCVNESTKEVLEKIQYSTKTRKFRKKTLDELDELLANPEKYVKHVR